MAPSTAPAGDAILAQVRVNDLRMRAEPATGADLITTLPFGSTHRLLEGPVEADGLRWYRVQLAGQTGWISSGEDGDWLARVTNGRIAFACLGCGDDAGRAIATSAADGSDRQVLHQRAGGSSWSPDGTRVIVEVPRDDDQPELILLPADRSSATSLGLGYGVAWAPGGERFAFIRPDGTIVVSDGSDEGIGFQATDHGGTGSLAWSPDGATIAFTAIDCPDCPLGEPIMGDPPISLFTFQPPGGEVVKVTDGANSGIVGWSPNGGAILYVDLDLGSGVLAMYSIPASGGSAVQVADGEIIGYGSDLSPDGTRLVAGAQEGIVVLAADGSESPRVIVPGGLDVNPMPQSPRWSPDGEWILFDKVWTTGDAIETWVVRADGTGERQLTDDGYYASWQPVLEPLNEP
ncbi:MAG TPA: SH3 domain-containing protein [Patescibacteria group bacterium]|nr:SH3 domain-containing protein [Patescibacteria group bacterium]